ncbi:hypothetical protein CR513_28762, partial [Mucuna pruriens]
MERLVKNEILPYLDFAYLNICVDCIKGKQTKHTKKEATRSTQLLEIVHTNICGPFGISSFNKEIYFITFIDDYSCYGYVYLLHEKYHAVDVLQIYLSEVERQLDKKVKVVKSDKGREYYKRYDEIGQHLGPFTKLLQKHGIFAQYTMLGTPQQNVPSKAIPKTPFELWTGRTHSLRHLHVWGC